MGEYGCVGLQAAFDLVLGRMGAGLSPPVGVGLGGYIVYIIVYSRVEGRRPVHVRPVGRLWGMFGGTGLI